MLRLAFLLAASFCCLSARAQLASAATQPAAAVQGNKEGAGARAEPEVLTYAEQMPAFMGGEAALHRFLATHLVYPPEALKAGRSATVVVQFVVDEQGRTRDVEVVRTSNPEFDAAARRVVLVMPWWEPGRENGQPVRVRCTLPIIFTFRRAL